jgi:isoleucyl-tRNA synthetase
MPKEAGMPDRVQLCDWPAVNEQWIDEEMAASWDKFLEAREVVSKALELARKDKVIGQSLEAQVTLYLDGDWTSVANGFSTWLAPVFIVSQVFVKKLEDAPADAVTDESVTGVAVTISRADGTKCERCWNYREDIGSDPQHPTICGRCATVLK